MYCIVAIAMLVVIGAMAMDGISGWRKAKERGEERTSYLFSRSITKFIHYEGALFIASGIDTLVHFVWAQFSNIVYCVPVVTCLGGAVLCVVEIWSMNEKADKKTRNSVNRATKLVGDALKDGQAVEVLRALTEIAEHNKKDEND